MSRTNHQDIRIGTLAAFSSGVTAARTQSQEAFSAVNDLVADASLDYAAAQPRRSALYAELV